MFPHEKLDWHLSRLKKRTSEAPDDNAARLDYAIHCLSRAQFHGGGEVWFNQALTQARRVLQADPTSPGALMVAGTSLVGLGRVDQAAPYLDEAVRLAPERADVRLARGALFQKDGDRHQAVRELEAACRHEPDAWEANWLLGKVLHERAEELGSPRRLMERSQFHTVRALSLGPSADLANDMLFQLGLTIVRTGRMEEANKIFLRLVDTPAYAEKARWFLGLTNYHLGRYKNSVLYLRRHLEEAPENPHVHARIAMAFLHLGELEKARKACNRALAIEPAHLGARWTLGCTLLEEGSVEEATRLFRDLLQDAPDHMPAFFELVRIRREAGDVGWMRTALKAEVAHHDAMVVHADRPDPATMKAVPVEPRKSTRERIAALRRSLCEVDPDCVPSLLEARNLTTDEGLRFELWEAALSHVAEERAKTASVALADPGKNYGAALGREILLLSDLVPETALTAGLRVDDDDLSRAAVDRNGPARDVDQHRRMLDRERISARAWQALLMLAVARSGSRTGRNLLVRWEAEADPELSAAARVGLCMLGDISASRAVRDRAARFHVTHLVDALVAHAAGSDVHHHPRPVSADEATRCSACRRAPSEVGHMMAGVSVALCDGCVAEVAKDRRGVEVEEPTASCGLCANTILECRAVYAFKGVHICADCVDSSLGLLEREEVDRYLATAL